jgi:hypothetical protein
MDHSDDILGPLRPDQDGGGSPRCHDASISVHAVLLDPAGVSSDHRLLRSPTVAFQVFDPVGIRMCHEAQSLHLRYGLDIALSTLNSCRHLHEPKTRFPVGRLVPFPGREFHPLKAPGLAWRTESGRGGSLQLLGITLSPCCPYQPRRSVSPLQSLATLHAAFARKVRARPSDFSTFEAIRVHLRYGPATRSPS